MWKSTSNVGKKLNDDSINGWKVSKYKAGKADKWSEDNKRYSFFCQHCGYCGSKVRQEKKDVQMVILAPIAKREDITEECVDLQNSLKNGAKLTVDLVVFRKKENSTSYVYSSF
ncbi:unnamed protein product [Lepeophtheirus salmonis]|uniref:(salmon louse) hypothetical protein n=1 Tax=Lepeophtheirus salmonis TaxID=72036 RepID=A0A7R8CT75_LEPSM|nr:unnamed protein product [Lepeophtheirus salmonis]CAF2921538.1 unnamed protein product [Lepeophtheirus salmonis]